MAALIFPSAEAFDIAKIAWKNGFTDGETIVINLYTGKITEENAEEAIDTIHTHELIHTMDMTIPEREVFHMSKVLLNILRS